MRCHVRQKDKVITPAESSGVGESIVSSTDSPGGDNGVLTNSNNNAASSPPPPQQQAPTTPTNVLNNNNNSGHDQLTNSCMQQTPQMTMMAMHDPKGIMSYSAIADDRVSVHRIRFLM